MKKLTTEEFIEKAKSTHGEKYDYSLVKLVNTKIKVCIICNIHGEFHQQPTNHMSGQGCPKCRLDTVSRKKTSNISKFIIKANKIHNNMYDYTDSIYIKSNIPLQIKCKIHGIFLQRPNDHLTNNGCPTCTSESKTKTTSAFIHEANFIHHNKYDYSLSEYKRNDLKLIIVCSIHGSFSMTPNSHTSGGQGCPKCRITRTKNTCMEKYGVTCATHVPEIHEKQQKYRWKDYTLPSGKIINIQGYENLALDELLKTYTENEIITQRKDIPEIWYWHSEDQNKHRYFPDIWIPKDNLIIEVKSKYTMQKDYEVNKLKEQAVLDAGYNYKFMIF